MTVDKKFKAMKKRMNITDREVGIIFGMGQGKTAPEIQFRTSTANKRYKEIFVSIFELIGQKQTEFFNLESDKTDFE